MIGAIIAILTLFVTLGGYFYMKYNKRISQLRMLWSLSEQLNVKKDTETSGETFKMMDSDICAKITYERTGQKCNLYIPVNLCFTVAMSQLRVEVIDHHGGHFDITQQPGLPYIVTAHDLGAEKIRVTNEETGDVHTYDKHTAPLYCKEVHE